MSPFTYFPVLFSFILFSFLREENSSRFSPITENIENHKFLLSHYPDLIVTQWFLMRNIILLSHDLQVIVFPRGENTLMYYA